ncbi:3-dehydro-L-gulonate 2-dehydrogenase [Fusobacterium sp. PH5-44]|uniref:3-dehydro-L-gulonate 2-dehydrogenase n=1 Tax=unclassified Fusobacterium TaxID=2648384 RepID=UPI003D242BA6
MIVTYNDLLNKFQEILERRGFDTDRAKKAATIFAKNSLDGVYSHGVNRFPRVISYIDKGGIDINAKPEKILSVGNIERWDGHLGMGVLNAEMAMQRACEIARESKIGIVALGNTNHWMRGGTYGWQAADAGYIGICWTNTSPNLQPWGGKTAKIGNNPFIISIPKSNGEHIVLDCALSQFSYGKIEEAKLAGRTLPIAGGYDCDGNLTNDPSEIEKSGRVVPVGYWKGSGLSILLDLLGAILSGGNTVTDIGKKYDMEIGLTQVMIAIDPHDFANASIIDNIIDNVIADIKSSELVSDNSKIKYPGESSFEKRNKNLKDGIPISDEVWSLINKL